jgi:hypothetical protein
VFGGAGLFVFVTASVGILSADCAGCGVTCFLGLYHALMVLLLLIQISVVCFYFFDKSWEKDLPKDTTGVYIAVAFVRPNALVLSGYPTACVDARFGKFNLTMRSSDKAR